MTTWGIILLVMLCTSTLLCIFTYQKINKLTCGILSLGLCSLHLLIILFSEIVMAAGSPQGSKPYSAAFFILLLCLTVPVLPVIGFLLAIAELSIKSRNIPAGIAGILFHLAVVVLGILYAFSKALFYLEGIGSAGA